jgi:hypothetical protein
MAKQSKPTQADKFIEAAKDHGCDDDKKSLMSN